MSALATTDPNAVKGLESALINGDLSGLNPQQRALYYLRVCESVGLNPLTKPFSYLQLGGKLVLYANRDCTDQLRKNNGVSISIKSRENCDGVLIVTASATDSSNRRDESTGAVSIQGLKGEALANAMMKAETKAKRRVTLSICGLGMLDETETETIPGAVRVEAEDIPEKSGAENPPRPNGKPASESVCRDMLDVIASPEFEKNPAALWQRLKGDYETLLTPDDKKKVTDAWNARKAAAIDPKKSAEIVNTMTAAYQECKTEADVEAVNKLIRANYAKLTDPDKKILAAARDDAANRVKSPPARERQPGDDEELDHPEAH